MDFKIKGVQIKPLGAWLHVHCSYWVQIGSWLDCRGFVLLVNDGPAIFRETREALLMSSDHHILSLWSSQRGSSAAAADTAATGALSHWACTKHLVFRMNTCHWLSPCHMHLTLVCSGDGQARCDPASIPALECLKWHVVCKTRVNARTKVGWCSALLCGRRSIDTSPLVRSSSVHRTDRGPLLWLPYSATLLLLSISIVRNTLLPADACTTARSEVSSLLI